MSTELSRDMWKALETGDAELLKEVAQKDRELLSALNEDGMSVAVQAAINELPDCLRVMAEVAPEALSKATEWGVTAAHLAAGHSSSMCLEIVVEEAPSLLLRIDNSGGLPSHCRFGRPGRGGGTASSPR